MEALKLCNLTWSPLKHFFHSHAFRRTPPVLVLRACSSSTAAADTRAAGRGRRSSESSSTTSTSDRDAIRAIRLKKVRASSVSCNGDVLLRFLLSAVFHVCVCVCGEGYELKLNLKLSFEFENSALCVFSLNFNVGLKIDCLVEL